MPLGRPLELHPHLRGRRRGLGSPAKAERADYFILHLNLPHPTLLVIIAAKQTDFKLSTVNSHHFSMLMDSVGLESDRARGNGLFLLHDG